jgi:hypothetical protein
MAPQWRNMKFFDVVGNGIDDDNYFIKSIITAFNLRSFLP